MSATDYLMIGFGIAGACAVSSTGTFSRLLGGGLSTVACVYLGLKWGAMLGAWTI